MREIREMVEPPQQLFPAPRMLEHACRDNEVRSSEGGSRHIKVVVFYDVSAFSFFAKHFKIFSQAFTDGRLSIRRNDRVARGERDKSVTAAPAPKVEDAAVFRQEIDDVF